MFGISKERFEAFADNVQGSLVLLRESVGLRLTRDELVTCEECGCAVLKKDAVKGPGRIVNEFSGNTVNEKIHHPFYCKSCGKSMNPVQGLVGALLTDLRIANATAPLFDPPNKPAAVAKSSEITTYEVTQYVNGNYNIITVSASEMENNGGYLDFFDADGKVIASFPRGEWMKCIRKQEEVAA